MQYNLYHIIWSIYTGKYDDSLSSCTVHGKNVYDEAVSYELLQRETGQKRCVGFLAKLRPISGNSWSSSGPMTFTYKTFAFSTGHKVSYRKNK